VIGEVRFMDLLYSRYSSPMDLMRLYIEQGRFGTFVDEFLRLENERRKTEAEKEQRRELWAMYIHSYTQESFDEFKRRVCKPVSTTHGSTTGSRDADLDEQGVKSIMDSLFS